MGKKKDSQFKQNTSGMTAGDIFWKELEEMPANTNRDGESFAMFTRKPLKDKKCVSKKKQ
jgi:hypothetical protein